MRYKFLLLFLSVLIAACSNNNKSENLIESNDIVIEGILEGGSDLLVTLDLMESNELIPINKMRCNENGEFKFTFDGEGLNYYSLKYTDNGYVTIIAQPGDKIQIEGSAENIYPYNLKGSVSSDLVKELSIEHKKALDQLVQISVATNELAGSESFTEKKMALNLRFDSIVDDFHSYSEKFIYKNASSPAILIALYNQFGPELPVFEPLLDLEIYKYADSALYANFPENEAVKSLHSELSAALQQIKNQQNKKTLSKGMPAPDFVLDDPEGNKISLSELRGNYVLLQIWASWSKPSVDENKYLKECNKRFGDKSFSIFQISIDSEKELWVNAIEDRDLNWKHASDLGRWESAIVNLYGIDRIPANYLIDPTGRIIKTDMFGDDLIQTIEKYIQ